MKTTKSYVTEYNRLRKLGFRASEAWRAAKVNLAWAEAEADDLVRMVCEPDEETYIEDSFERPDHMFDRSYKRACEAVANRGIWCYAAQYRNAAGNWETADSVGACDGDIADTGYDVDLKDSALRAAFRTRLSA